jgi:hypothetical protein
MAPGTLVGRTLLAASLIAAAGCEPACEVVSQFPVITAVRPNWNANTQTKVLAATIVQNNGPLNESLVVRCDVFRRPPRTQAPTVIPIPAERLAGNTFNCTLPDDLSDSIRNNDVVVFEWIVESMNAQGDPVPVARSPVAEFHVGCEDPAQFLRNDQQMVVNSFGALTTAVELAAAGYVPTHPTVTFVNAVPFPVNKVFRGMGAAFARAQDILSAGNFVPSGLPQSGRPNLLLLLPSMTVAGSPDLSDPAATYSLIGWAYAVNLTTSDEDTPPDAGCFPRHEWFFHEEGHHTADGGFSPGLGSALGPPHARLWDIHVWRRPDGLPALGILNIAGGVTTPAAGYQGPANSFFYPE